MNPPTLNEVKRKERSDATFERSENADPKDRTLNEVKRKERSDATKDKVLDIAMNLTRVGGWAAEDYARKRKRIVQFLDETEEYLDDLESKSVRDSSSRFQKTFQKFQKEFPRLAKEGKAGPKNSLFWAEEMLTWGTILTHRAKLIS